MNTDHIYTLVPGASIDEESGEMRAAVAITIDGETVIFWTDSARALARDLQRTADVADKNTRERAKKGKAS